jgi:ketosteroid isomerase-like protein
MPKKGSSLSVVFFLFLFLVALARAGAATPSGDSWEQEVRAAEQKHRAAFLAGDVAALQAMFSDDFVVNSPLNVVVDKARLLDMVRKGVLTISSFEQNIEQVRKFGDVVVVMGGDKVVYAAPSPNAGRTDRRRFTDLWRSEGGRWRFVARQANIICP